MDERELREWRRILTAAIDEWGASGAVHPLCADPELFVFATISDALLARDRVEEVIEIFISTDAWPPLSAELTIYLLHRARLARSTVDHFIQNETARRAVQPTPSGKAAFARWLLIDVWNIAGPDYMKAWADEYLEKNPPPPGYRVSSPHE